MKGWLHCKSCCSEPFPVKSWKFGLRSCNLPGPLFAIPFICCCHCNKFCLNPTKSFWRSYTSCTKAASLALNIWDFTLCKQKSSLDKHLPEIPSTWHLNVFSCRVFVITFLNSPVHWYSHSIMSKKIGIVAFRSSTSGIRVISKMGPTIPGIKQILFWPATKPQIEYLKRKPNSFRETSRSCNHLKQCLKLCWSSLTTQSLSSVSSQKLGAWEWILSPSKMPEFSARNKQECQRSRCFSEEFSFSAFDTFL